eukprot:gene38279-51699_t
MIWLRASLLVLAPALFAFGISLPLLRFETLFVFSETASLLSIISGLAREGDTALAVVVGLFSVVFPAIKLVGVAAEQMHPTNHGEKTRLSKLMPLLARWSMMDVVLVALVIFAAKTSGLAEAFTQPGLWCYALSSLAAVARPSKEPADGLRRSENGQIENDYKPMTGLNQTMVPQCSMAILLNTGGSQPRKAVVVDGCLPGQKLLDCQGVAFASFFEAQQATAHSGDNLCLATDNPTARIGRRKIGNRQGAAIGADDIFHSWADHFGHWTLYTHSRPHPCILDRRL